MLKDQPIVYEYPSEDPHILDQLTDFSIAPDIRLYEVSPKYLYEPFTEEKVDTSNKKKAFPLRNLKPNTVMTLSLEA